MCLCAYHLSVAQTTKSFRWLTCTFNFANNLIGNRLCVCSSETTHWFLLFSMPIYCRLPSCFRWNWWLTMMMKMTMTITKWIFDEQMFWLNSDNFEMFHSLCSLCVCLPHPHSLALSRPFYISDSESLSLTIPCVLLFVYAVRHVNDNTKIWYWKDVEQLNLFQAFLFGDLQTPLYSNFYHRFFINGNEVFRISNEWQDWVMFITFTSRL